MILNMEWSNKLILEFLNVYKNEPTLWNMSTPEHNSKYEVYEAWKRIKTQLQDGSIPIHEIKKKRDSLMATYRRQKIKVRNSMRNGSENTIKPKWPFYNIMDNFLNDIYEPRETKSDDTTKDVLAAIDIKDDIEESSGKVEEDIPISHITNPKRNKKCLPKKKKLHVNKKYKKRIDKKFDFLKEISIKSDPDECSLYCELLCQKLRSLRESTRELAMLEIDKLIYNIKQKEYQTFFPQTPQLQNQDPLQSTT